jgi:hypothetical protein
MLRLSRSVMRVFLEEPDISKINTAVTFLRDSLRIKTQHNLEPSASLGGLASALYARFYRAGQIEDLHEAILLYQESITNTLHPDQLGWIHNLCAALLTRFGKTGQFQDLRDAAALYSGSLSPSPEAAKSPEREHSVSCET